MICGFSGTAACAKAARRSAHTVDVTPSEPMAARNLRRSTSFMWVSSIVAFIAGGENRQNRLESYRGRITIARGVTGLPFEARRNPAELDDVWRHPRKRKCDNGPACRRIS